MSFLKAITADVVHNLPRVSLPIQLAPYFACKFVAIYCDLLSLISDLTSRAGDE